MMTRLALHRLAALGLLFSLIAMAVFGVVLPAVEHIQGIREQHRLNLALIERLEPMTRRETLSASQITDFQERLAADPRFLQGATRALASATLQQQLKLVAARYRAELQTIQELRQGEDPQELRLRFALAADYQDLVRLVHELESEEPLLFVDAIEIKSVRAADARDHAAEGLPVSAKLDLRGYLPPRVDR